MGKLIVTITPPTPNGNLHLGHIAGPFLAADVFARVHRMKGHEVVFLCYSDDYQSYVARKAIQLGSDRFELAALYAAEIEKTLSMTGISLDWFLRSHGNEYFREAITFFYDQALRNGAIGTRTEEVPFSEEDQLYGYEAFARGTCNYCGHESDASQCENCAQAPDLHQMGDLVSVFSKKKMRWQPETREFLELERYRLNLRDYYRKLPLRPYLRGFLERTLEREIPGWPIDRPGECGIDIDSNGHHIRLHTWFSGIAGYLAAFREFAASLDRPEMTEQFWFSPDTRIAHFLGFDCSFSHAIVYPSMIYNCPGMTRDIHYFPNKFLKLEGDDFSTSRGVAIWVNDILQEAPLDAVRFYLALHSPEEETTNFEKEKFNDWTFRFFLPAIDRLRSFLAASEKELDCDQLPQDDAARLYGFWDNWEKYASSEAFSIRGLAAILDELLDFITKIPDREQERGRTWAGIYLVFSRPLHPDLSEELISRFGIGEEKMLRQSGIFQEATAV